MTEFQVRQDHGHDKYYCNLVFDGVKTIAGIPLINESNSFCVLKPESLGESQVQNLELNITL